MKTLIASLFSLVICSQAQALTPEDYKDFITQWEGYRNKVYTCPAGYQTIGIGHKLRAGENWTYINNDRVNFVFYKDLGTVLDFIPKYIKDFSTQPDEVKLILVDLGFNLGEGRFAKFKKTIRACNSRDYITMAWELKDSKWYHQVGNRSKHHVRELKNINDYASKL